VASVGLVIGFAPNLRAGRGFTARPGDILGWRRGGAEKTGVEKVIDQAWGGGAGGLCVRWVDGGVIGVTIDARAQVEAGLGELGATEKEKDARSQAKHFGGLAGL
jgi:hypothetical protein